MVSMESSGPIIEELGPDGQPIVDETTVKDETPSGGESAEKAFGGEAQNESETSRQTRAQKKVLKAMSKLNLKHVPGIVKVVIRRKGNILFSILGGEVYKSPGSDTYIVFGEAQPEDLLSKAQMSKAAEKFKAPTGDSVQGGVSAPTVAKIEEEDDEEENEEEIDTEGVEEKDIELVMQQAGVNKVKAVKALKNNANDIVNAIMELTM
jgi:nascent polypeptide-associated complex subunit alpha